MPEDKSGDGVYQFMVALALTAPVVIVPLALAALPHAGMDADRLFDALLAAFCAFR